MLQSNWLDRLASRWRPESRRRRIGGLLVLGAVTVLFVLFLEPIRQDPAYHNFADQRRLWGLPNAADVLSNLLFAIAGLWGLWGLRNLAGDRFHQPWERWGWAVVCLAMFSTSLGSSYYHWEPHNVSLFWDRLPMTVAFMSLLGLVIAERVSFSFGKWALIPLVLVGIASALVWHIGERQGAGDLRFYAVVQAGSVLAVPLLLVLFAPRYERGSDLLIAVGWYLLAKLLELLDRTIYALGAVVAGHALKHLAAGVACLVIVRMVLRRRRVVRPSS